MKILRIIVFLAVVVFGLFALAKNFLYKTKPESPAQNRLESQKENTSVDTPFSRLDVPLEYFSEKDIRSGFVKEGAVGKKITDFTGVSLESKTVYQSYPTTTVTIEKYLSERKPQVTKSINEAIKQQAQIEPDGWGKDRVKENFQQYGSLASHYLPKDFLMKTEKFDVTGDGKPETVVTYNSVAAADAGSYHTDVVQGNTIIFSVLEDNAAILAADTTNGFYVEWRSPNDSSPRCCPEGFMRTRFVYKDGKFIPLFEQEVKYLKVGKE